MDWFEQIKRQAMQMAVEKAEAAAKDVSDTFIRTLDEGKVEDDDLSGYRPSQKRRRERMGLQTSYKDLQYSGQMANSVKEKNRETGKDFVAITLAFSGKAFRRSDQNDGLDNETLAGYLSIQQRKGRSILRLPTKEKERIESKYRVTIEYDS